MTYSSGAYKLVAPTTLSVWCASWLWSMLHVISVHFLLPVSPCSFVSFFFLMLRPPRRSPLFPYPPLFRSPLERALGRLHHSPIFFDRVRAGFGDSFRDRRIHFRLRCACRQVRLENDKLFLLFVDEVLAAALSKLIDRFLALFHQRLQQLDRFLLIQLSHFIHFFELKRCLRHAQDAQLHLVLGLHGRHNIFLNRLAETHCWPSPAQTISERGPLHFFF